jgi:hypothetical protein
MVKAVVLARRKEVVSQIVLSTTDDNSISTLVSQHLRTQKSFEATTLSLTKILKGAMVPMEQWKKPRLMGAQGFSKALPARLENPELSHQVQSPSHDVMSAPGSTGF